MATPITPVRIPHDLKSDLDRQAKREGKSRSQIIYDSIRLYLETNKS
jgi:metal-responsive CopG/Arc/MetJ family transcriptional regulator